MIELYQSEECPYSGMVRQKLSDLNLDWIARSAPKGAPQRRKLVELGGKEQIPFLYDPDKDVKIYESKDIIEYLEKNYGRI